MSTGSGQCHVRVLAPDNPVDLALPADVPLADLLPTIRRHTGLDPTPPAAQNGWALARPAESPLDTSRTCAELEIHDGDQLLFKPLADLSDDFVFDDVADAIGTAARRRRGQWTTHTSRTVSLSIAGIVTVLGAVVCALAGPPQQPGALTALAMAVLLEITALVLARVIADTQTATLTGIAALPYAFVGGLLLLAADRPLPQLAAPHLLVGLVFVGVGAIFSALAVADHVEAFTAAAVTAFVGAVGALLATLTSTGAAAAAVVADVALAATPTLPMLSFRLARLPMPTVPSDPDELRADIEPVPGRRVLAASDKADRYLTGFLVGTAVLTMIAELTLALAGNLWTQLLCLAIAVAVLLRAREFDRIPQRLPLLCAGLLGLALSAAATAGDLNYIARLVIALLAVLAAGAACLVYALSLPGIHLSPYWGRTLDILEIVAVLTLIPLTLLVLGVPQYVRGLGG